VLRSCDSDTTDNLIFRGYFNGTTVKLHDD